MLWQEHNPKKEGLERVLCVRVCVCLFTAGTKIIADPEKCFQESIAEFY